MADAIDFDAPDIARRVEALSQHELDQLPFGVILVDRHFVVRFYSATEARESGSGMAPLGHDLFETWHRSDKNGLRDRMMRALEESPADIDLALKGDAADPNRELRMRIVTARNSGVWLFVDRDKR